MSDIKILFIPKMKGNKQPATVVKAMKEYLSFNAINHIIVSPGYLSKTEKTIDYFVKQFSTEIGKKWKVYLLNGMNGWHKTKKSSSKIMNLHVSKGASIGLTFTEIGLARNKANHSKIIFLINSEERDTQILLDLINNKKSTDDDIDELLESIDVKAIMIGSSNYSYNTYFKSPADKGEADVFLFKEENENTYKRFQESIEKGKDARVGDIYADCALSKNIIAKGEYLNSIFKSFFKSLIKM